RVTVAEAAKMGGCKVEDFERVLQPLGYRFTGNEQQAANAAVPTDTTGKEKPHWLKAPPEEDIIKFDVRPIIEHGVDPLKEIMRKFKEVPDGKILCIINTFVPTPLIHLLEKDKAEASFVDTISTMEFHTYFLKRQKNTSGTDTTKAKTVMHDAASFEKICSLFNGEKRKTIDVRDLEMPLPMQTILAELETLPAGHGLYVHHKRVPVYLLEELASKDFPVHIYNIGEGDVKMLIFKD
ncbi:MAG TPA: DUF2249 domain-containing protein, partial [Niabella sp.]|nr:DUF2249 domain-containing protein [Niabella sp.]